jgi:hypothetical protein
MRQHPQGSVTVTMQAGGVWPTTPLTDPQPLIPAIAATPAIACGSAEIIQPIRS